jgi:hypothetical protein
MVTGCSLALGVALAETCGKRNVTHHYKPVDRDLELGLSEQTEAFEEVLDDYSDCSVNSVDSFDYEYAKVMYK